MNTFGGNSLLNNDEFINLINVADFLLNIVNMNLNVTADDLENHSNRIMEGINRHLNEQDERLARIEAMFQTERGSGGKRRK